MQQHEIRNIENLVLFLDLSPPVDKSPNNVQHFTRRLELRKHIITTTISVMTCKLN